MILESTLEASSVNTSRRPCDDVLMQVIAFFFEYYSREKHSSDLLSFCPGSLTYLLLQSGKPSWLSLHRQYAILWGTSCYLKWIKRSVRAAEPAEVSVITAPLKVGHVMRHRHISKPWEYRNLRL